ncbi:hypothetical protein CALVIDRAFT_534931 [Calocera viscosa TUFC12733]|uniref:C2H2-type domain-containing protein n=1 Tax=Calocera viscosa (strain TUFC12733) TaxID=1330018 RepID=A0A167PJ41_CALVF|nr:hypothetical protein CALVIDRAFT_534931 [Calocera viscosa TUFC12733]
MSQRSFYADSSYVSYTHEVVNEPFSVRSASGLRVSILNPDPDYPAVVDPRAIAGPSVPIVRITKTYRCNSCPKVFTSSGHLQRHGRVHSGEKQFTCPYPDCHKQCNRQDNLLQHYKIHLPRSDRNRGPEYLNMAFAEMVASQSLSLAANGFSHIKTEPAGNNDLHSGSSTSPISATFTASSTSPVIGSMNGLHILAASALDSSSTVRMSEASHSPAESNSTITLRPKLKARVER